VKFAYHLPVNLLFGRGQAEETGKRTAALGKKVFLVTGRGSTRKSGLLDRVTRQLEAAGAGVVVFGKIMPNPTTTVIAEGAALLKAGKCDVVLGLGGGSIMDAAKAIAFMAKNDGPLMDYVYGRKDPGEALPIVLVPTTCGTGSEGNGFAVVTDPDTGDKKSLRCNQIIARLSIIDPDLMTTMPPPVLASVGFDALCHLIEAYISRIAQPVSSALALDGISRIACSLARLYNGAGSADDWEAQTWAATLGGMCIGIAGITAPHGLEHPPSGLRDIVHGRGLAALCPAIYRRTVDAAPALFDTLSRSLGGKSHADFLPLLDDLLARLGLTAGLAAQGVKPEDIGWLAENALKVSAAGIANHPVQFGLDEIKSIYREAL